MIKTLKGLLGLAHREDATTAEIAPSLPAAELELDAALSGQQGAEAAYTAGLLIADDAALRKLVDARTEAGVRVDRAKAILTALRERHAEAELREAEAQRIAVYEAARAQADDARRALGEMYPALASDLVALLEIVALAEIEVRRVNADLPRGAQPLDGVEGSVRDIAAVPDELISETVIERWVKVGETYPGNLNQELVYRTGQGRGVVQYPGLPLNQCDEAELRRFTERRVRERVGYQAAPRLSKSVVLPGLKIRDKEFWRPSEDNSSPEEFLSRLYELRSREQFYEPERKVILKLTADAGAKPVESHRRPTSFGARGAR